MRYLTATLERARVPLGVPRRRLARVRAAAAAQARRPARLARPRTRARVLFADDAGEPASPRRDRRRLRLLLDRGHPRPRLGRRRRPDAQGRFDDRHPVAARDPHARRRGIVLPEIRDAERLQGFDADWTAPGRRRRASRRASAGSSSATPSASRSRSGSASVCARPGELTTSRETSPSEGTVPGRTPPGVATDAPYSGRTSRTSPSSQPRQPLARLPRLHAHTALGACDRGLPRTHGAKRAATSRTGSSTTSRRTSTRMRGRVAA